ncbi:hypothetical protein [Calidifontibacter terrae]
MTSRVLTMIAEPDVPALHEHELPMAHLAYGGIALLVFFLMLGVLWSFRNTSPKVSEQDGHRPGSNTGATDHTGPTH